LINDTLVILPAKLAHYCANCECLTNYTGATCPACACATSLVNLLGLLDRRVPGHGVPETGNAD
jgi:hypothetical protein